MPIRVGCPSCGATLSVADGSAGKTIHCPKCRAAIALPAAPPRPAMARVVRRPAAKDAESIPTASYAEDGPIPTAFYARDDADDEPGRPHRKRRKKKVSPVWGYLGAGFGLLLVLALPAVRIAKVVLWNNNVAEREAKHALLLDKTRAETPAPPELTAGLVGDIPGEPSVSQADSIPRAPLRPRATDPLFQLSNLRETANPRPSSSDTTFAVDYRLVRKGAGPVEAPSLYVRIPQGTPSLVTRSVFSHPLQRFNPEADTIEFSINAKEFGFNFRMNKVQVTDVEVYVAVTDPKFAYGRPFKASASLATGGMRETCASREWTAKEAEAIRTGRPLGY